MSHDTDDTDDESTNRTGNGLTIDDLTAGMRIECGQATFAVVESPHVEDLALRRIAGSRGAAGNQGDLVSVHSDFSERMFREEEVWPLQTYNAETHVAIPRVAAAIAADEVDWVLEQFEATHLKDPSREELLDARNHIYDALGYEHERNNGNDPHGGNDD